MWFLSFIIKGFVLICLFYLAAKLGWKLFKSGIGIFLALLIGFMIWDKLSHGDILYTDCPICKNKVEYFSFHLLDCSFDWIDKNIIDTYPGPSNSKNH